MQNNWWTELAERTQRYADIGDMCAFYEALKAIYGPSHQIQAPLRSSDGSTQLTDKEAILQRGEKSDCSNYRGITLLSIAGKILARVLLNRLIPTIAQENTPESQCGFRSNNLSALEYFTYLDSVISNDASQEGS